jgi:hypothetical protein
MGYEPRSVYEFGDDVTVRVPVLAAAIVIAAPRPLPTTPTFEAIAAAADGATYLLTYRLTQRPEAWVGVLESCRPYHHHG